MREINVSEIENAVSKLSVEANLELPNDVIKRISECKSSESNKTALSVFDDMTDNIEIARQRGIPVCQDTGMAVIFLEVGQDVHFVGGELYEAVNRGVARGYTDGFLRKSVVKDPLDRINTGDNTPAVIHTDIVPGDKVKLTVAPKGFGSENMSAVRMMLPSSSKEDVMETVVSVVKNAASNPCPPMVVGVGIGGDFEQCALLSKKALCRDLYEENENPFYAEMEKELLERVNALGIGPQGFGGDTTALKVNIMTAPTHIAGLPVAVNIGCHVTRHKTVII